MNYIMISYDKWIDQYKPINDAYMYETYGEEVAIVKAQNPLTVWTLGNAGEGDYIQSGMHFVNRIGYYISEIPFGADDDIFVEIESEWDSNYEIEDGCDYSPLTNCQ
jgi:hypothetical protein